MTFVTLENFDTNKVVLGNIYSSTKPVHFQVVPIQYKYSSSCTGDLIIRTLRLASRGVFENRERTNQVFNGYSLGLKIPNSDDDSRFHNSLLHVTEIIKNKKKKKKKL